MIKITLCVSIALICLPSPLFALRTYFCEDERQAHINPILMQRLAYQYELAEIEANFAAYMRDFRANHHDKLMADLAVILDKIRPLLPRIHPHNKNEIKFNRVFEFIASA